MHYQHKNVFLKIDISLRSVIERGGVDTETAYPYTGKDHNQCRYNVHTIGAKIKTYKNVSPFGSESIVFARFYKVFLHSGGPFGPPPLALR